MTRRIAVVTSSRADYGHLYWPLKEIEAHADLELDLIVFGAHLSPLFGETIGEIEADGFPIGARIDCLDPDDSDVGMARTIGSATSQLADYLGANRPDILLIIADRYEMLAPASVALALRIPIAHIEGGDISEGAVDDAVRNALTKMAHLHFTPTEEAKKRVLAMGEEDWRVTWSGAPSLDHLVRSTLPGKPDVEEALDCALSAELCVVAYHPVTLHQDTTDEAATVMAALDHWSGDIVFCFPNADAGRSEIIRRVNEFCKTRDNARLYVNLNHLIYWSLLQHARIMFGNSSSGIMESPSLKLPCVDVGDRQRGRTRAKNVIHAEVDEAAIVAAMQQANTDEFREALTDMKNPYGDGRAATRIVEGLAAAPDRNTLLHKRALDLNADRSGFQQ